MVIYQWFKILAWFYFRMILNIRLNIHFQKTFFNRILGKNDHFLLESEIDFKASNLILMPNTCLNTFFEY